MLGLQKTPLERKRIISWALYDWANSAFATTVVAGLFPIFFKDFWCKNLPATESTFYLGLSISIAGLLVAIAAPLLGAFADQGSAKKRLLFLFAMLGIAMTGSFFFVGEGNWQTAMFLYILANIGFLCSNTFYDSLLLEVSTPNNVDWVSGFGYALGYIGGGILFLFNVIMIQNPSWFGLESAAQAVQLSFVSVALWWAIFSVPIFLYVPETTGNKNLTIKEAAKLGFGQLFQTFREIKKYRMIVWFLLAYWLYIDGVDTIISMAVDYGKSLGIENSDLITALLMVQFVAFPFSLFFGILSQSFGTKRMIIVGILIYILVTWLGANLDLVPVELLGFSFSKFFIIAFLVGMVQGGVQSLSRSYFSRLIPKDKAAEFFGFYNMIGKFAAIIGPFLMGLVTVLTGDPRMGIQSIAILFILGIVLLLIVSPAEKYYPKTTK